MTRVETECPFVGVELLPPSPAGRLYPHYHADWGVLFVESAEERKWPRSMDVDGTASLYIDATGILGRIDLVFKRELWPVAAALPELPEATIEADLRLSGEAIDRGYSDVEVVVQANAAKSRVVLFFGEVPDFAEGVRLSEACIALVRDSCLHGFDVRLDQGTEPSSLPVA